MTYKTKKPEAAPTKVSPPRKNLKQVNSSVPSDPNYAVVAENLVVGIRVRRLRFGKGVITKIEGESPNQKATIQFDEIGEKQLLLKFAKLMILK